MIPCKYEVAMQFSIWFKYFLLPSSIVVTNKFNRHNELGPFATFNEIIQIKWSGLRFYYPIFYPSRNLGARELCFRFDVNVY